MALKYTPCTVFQGSYLVVAKVRERLAVSKQAAQKFDGERFNLRKLNELEVRKQYQTEITNTFAALENLKDSEDINSWENIELLKTKLNLLYIRNQSVLRSKHFLPRL